MIEYKYGVILQHENDDLSRELHMNNFDSAEATFNTIVKGLEKEIGNFTVILVRNHDKKSLKSMIKDY